MNEPYPIEHAPKRKREKPGALNYGLDMAADAWLLELNREEREALYEHRSTLGPAAGFLGLAESALQRAMERYWA